MNVSEDCRITADDVVLSIRYLLETLGRAIVIEELGDSGCMRVTLSALLPVDIGGEIVDMVREHQVRR